MGRALKILLICLGVWVGFEIYLEGPRNAFGGLFDFSAREQAAARDTRTTPQRAGDAVRKSQAIEAERRERLLPD